MNSAANHNFHEYMLRDLIQSRICHPYDASGRAQGNGWIAGVTCFLIWLHDAAKIWNMVEHIRSIKENISPNQRSDNLFDLIRNCRDAACHPTSKLHNTDMLISDVRFNGVVTWNCIITSNDFKIEIGEDVIFYNKNLLRGFWEIFERKH